MLSRRFSRPKRHRMVRISILPCMCSQTCLHQSPCLIFPLLVFTHQWRWSRSCSIYKNITKTEIRQPIQLPLRNVRYWFGIIPLDVRSFDRLIPLLCLQTFQSLSLLSGLSFIYSADLSIWLIFIEIRSWIRFVSIRRRGVSRLSSLSSNLGLLCSCCARPSQHTTPIQYKWIQVRSILLWCPTKNLKN